MASGSDVGRCTLCGAEIQSSVAMLCIRCYRANMIPCPECNATGRVVAAYIDKRERGYVVRKRKQCGTCIDERFVLRDPLVKP